MARIIETDMIPGPVETQSYVRLKQDVMDFSSALPIIVIENFGSGSIPDKGWSYNGSEIHAVAWQPAHMILFEPHDGYANLTGTPHFDSRIGIRVRGGSSSEFAEPGYALEAWADGMDNDRDITPLNMSASSNWVLYAPNPWLDQSLMHNSFLFELSRQLGWWAPDFRYVQAFINTDGGDLTMSDFAGLYLIIERVDANRLKIEELAADAREGGWLLEVNRMEAVSLDGQLPLNSHTAGPDGTLQTPPDQTTLSGQGDDIPQARTSYFNFASPSSTEINDRQRESIQDWMKNMEDVLYGRTDVAWNDPTDGYAKYIDVDSFIDYFILQNIAMKPNGLQSSFWLYNRDPNNGGKLTFGPIWDNDEGTFRAPSDRWLMNNAQRMWFGQLFDDPDFVQRYADRWQTLRDGALSSANMAVILDDVAARIGDQAARNDQVLDWSERLDTLKKWLITRTAAIDATYVPRPIFNTTDTVVSPGFVLSMAAERGTIYYTTDGSDPRIHGGAVSPEVELFTVPAEVTRDITIRARSYDNGEWSGLKEAMIVTARAGDANEDGCFDQLDIVEVLQASKYETSQLASFQEGDWNGDSVFDELDVAFALRTGSYLREQ